MQPAASNQSDSTLLESWCVDRSEAAFTELVRRYERLVTGAALRAVGNLEFAQDATQQVFAILAAKARILAGRPNIAGWLHRTANHIATRMRRADTRRIARHDAASESSLVQPEDSQWGILEESLLGMSALEREALVLHYFQDLSYSELAQAVGLSEAAARKRVSRAVKSLGNLLRKRGISSPKALLVGAAALQGTYATQATLAVTAIAGTHTVSTPLTLLLHTLMSHLPVKLAIGAATLALVPLGYEWTTARELHAELAGLQQARALADPSPIPVHPTADDHPVLNVRVELERVQAARKAAEARVAELTSFQDRAREEFVVSMGNIDTMAKGLGSTMRQVLEIRERMENRNPGTPEWKDAEAKMKEAAAKVPDALSMMRELPRLERSPAKAARFYATLLGEVAELDDQTRAAIEPPLQAWVAQLQRDLIAFPQRPANDTGQWDQRRVAAMQVIDRELKALVPPDKTRRTSLLRTLAVDPKRPQEAFHIISGRTP